MQEKIEKNNDISERIRCIIDNEGININIFAQKIGLKRSQLVYDVINGKTMPGFKFFFGFENSVFSEKYNIGWLLTGEGSMLKSEEKGIIQGNKGGKNSTNIAGNNNFLGGKLHDAGNKSSLDEKKRVKVANHQTEKQGIPLIPLDAVAGFNGEDNEGITYESCEQYYVPEFTTKGVEFLIRVSGDSMQPLYLSGDILACKKVKDIIFFQWGKVYVIDCSQGVMVKRIVEDREDKDRVVCVSENDKYYYPFSIPKEDIRSLSVILGLVRIE